MHYDARKQRPLPYSENAHRIVFPCDFNQVTAALRVALRDNSANHVPSIPRVPQSFKRLLSRLRLDVNAVTAARRAKYVPSACKYR
eukprot:1825840-Pleurochrysis_carterae.AAC.5